MPQAADIPVQFNRIEGAVGLPPAAGRRSVEEHLATLDDAAFGAASEVTPNFIAPADPASGWTAAHRGPAFFAYAPQSAQFFVYKKERRLHAG